MSGQDIDVLMEIWALDKGKHNKTSPFESIEHMYKVINATKVRDAPWKCCTRSYEGEVSKNSASSKHDEYQVWYCNTDMVIHNLLDNPDFNGLFDYQPYVETDKDGKWCWNNIMSGNFAWHHSVCSMRLSFNTLTKEC